MEFTFYEDNNFYYFWKNHWLATSYGPRQSFLELFDKILILDIKVNSKIYWIIWYLNEVFGRNNEYWLLNRLDNDTAGLLYFAKNFYVYNNFKTWQTDWTVNKIYIADVTWNFRYDNFIIDFPIMHHIQLNDRMVVIKNDNDLSKGRGEKHFQQTIIEKLFYDENKNISTLQVTIKQWIRHQIRAHLSSIGYPIIWDKIYNKVVSSSYLHLWSIWLNIYWN